MIIVNWSVQDDLKILSSKFRIKPVILYVGSLLHQCSMVIFWWAWFREQVNAQGTTGILEIPKLGMAQNQFGLVL